MHATVFLRRLRVARLPAFSFTLLPVNAEIIAVGSELLTPFRMDTNSLYLTEQINQLGVEVIFKTVVGDDLGHLVGSRAACAVPLGGCDFQRRSRPHRR